MRCAIHPVPPHVIGAAGPKPESAPGVRWTCSSYGRSPRDHANGYVLYGHVQRGFQLPGEVTRFRFRLTSTSHVRRSVPCCENHTERNDHSLNASKCATSSSVCSTCHDSNGSCDRRARAACGVTVTPTWCPTPPRSIVICGSRRGFEPGTPYVRTPPCGVSAGAAHAPANRCGTDG